jgi:hypothetical protein
VTVQFRSSKSGLASQEIDMITLFALVASPLDGETLHHEALEDADHTLLAVKERD